MNKRKLGSDYEEIAIEYLESIGYKVIEKNFRCKIGEIDIIAKDGDYICFIEVKYRKNTNFGFPDEAISKNKRHTIFKVAKFFLNFHRYPEHTSARFDTVLILGSEIKLIKNAFGGL